ncbi:MAG TPA: hypothetical protein VN607_04560 [Gemmatimonadaceae bacterium]|nr:hypothetical protein [Gemmatimonadaceae bacterium]
MSSPVRIALVGDQNDAVTAHRAIPIALDRAAADDHRTVAVDWLHTSSLGSEMAARLADANGVWCIPGSPYANMDAALSAIGFARRSGVPFLGTCAGFQHALIEYARTILGLTEADHAETNPDAAHPLISALSCGLVDVHGRVHLAGGTRLHAIYGCDTAVEEYHCNYGLDMQQAGRFAHTSLRVSGVDDDGAARCIELTDHPFFVATLFQPERAALAERSHPVVGAFFAAAAAHADRHRAAPVRAG